MDKYYDVTVAMSRCHFGPDILECQSIATTMLAIQLEPEMTIFGQEGEMMQCSGTHINKNNKFHSPKLVHKPLGHVCPKAVVLVAPASRGQNHYLYQEMLLSSVKLDILSRVPHTVGAGWLTEPTSRGR